MAPRPAADELLLFLHIPKAAGTTLVRIIERQYPTGTVHRCRDVSPRVIADAIARRPPDAPALSCVMGHMLFGLHAYLRQPGRYVTMLRHPVSRVVSHYEYVRRTPEHYAHREVVDRRLSLEAYVASGLSSEVNDGQVRLLCGRDGAEAVPHGEVSQDMLEAAVGNLRAHALAVGLSERFDESLLLFQRLLGWPDVRYTPENTAPGARPPITPAARAVIERYNALDLRLYEHGRRVLEQALAAAGIDRDAVETFRARNRRYRLLTAVGRRIAHVAVRRRSGR
jgi:hypothetical protein